MPKEGKILRTLKQISCPDKCLMTMEITTPAAETNANINYSNSTNQTNHWSTLFLMIVDKCNSQDASYIRLPIEILTLVLGLPTNVALLWLLMRGDKALSPSELLGLNLAWLNIIFCVSLPIDMYLSLGKRSGLLLSITESISVFNIFGCPLLLTCMCVERYMAAAHALLYMKLGSKWGYRAVCSVFIWILTLCIAGVTCHQRLPQVAVYLSIILDVFILLKLACLLGIVRELCKKGPGAGQTGAGGGSSIKMRALQNTLMVLMPSLVIYGPLLGLAPYIMTLTDEKQEASDSYCNVLHLCHVYPSLGTCIGPVFYISRARQLFCRKKRDDKEQPTAQELQHDQ